MSNGRVVVMMGSKSDLEHVRPMVAQLSEWGVESEMHIASAHKSPRYLLDIVSEINETDRPTVFIAVAGRSNALAGMLDASTRYPVITCPPISSTFAGADIFSSLRMPSGVAPSVVLDPKGAALAAAKILALGNRDLADRVAAYQQDMTDSVIAADKSL